MQNWTRNQKIATWSIVVMAGVGLLAILAGLAGPEVRRFLGLGRNSGPTSDLQVTDFQIGDFEPDKPITGKLNFYNSDSINKIDYYSPRAFVTTVLPRNETTIPWFVNKVWDKWTSTLRKDNVPKLEIGPGQRSWVSIDHEAKPIESSAFESAKAQGSVLSLIVIGFLQYSDNSGLHQTDYCYIYHGVPGVYLLCGTHTGPSNPTLLK